MSDELLSSNLNAAITINKLKKELETTKKLLVDNEQFWQFKRTEMLLEVQTTKRLLDEAVEVIRFYADGSSWQSFNVGDDIPMRSDREDHFSVAGMRARRFIKEFFKDKGVS